MRRLHAHPIASALALLAALALALGGCGAAGTAKGATVSVYVASPLCAEAGRELARSGGEAGELHVRLECLAATGEGGRTSLATVGANARRATQDSAAVAYVEGPGATAGRFSRPIVEAADLAWLEAGSGRAAMRRVLGAVAAAGSGSVRDAVRESLDG